MLKAGFDVLFSILSFLKYPLYFILGILALFYLLVFINVIIGFLKGKRFKKGTRKKLKKHGFFRRIFIDFPKQYVDDLFAVDPDFFYPQGLIIFEGRQGSGKTSSMVEYALRLQKEYPLSKCTSNLCYKNEDVPLTNWRMLLNYKNDIHGVIVLLDELQNWFSSNDSKNFPPEMLQIITQNRKNRRIMLGTSQNFYLLSKPIRSQTTEVRRCATFLGCLTIVRRFEPILDPQGDVQEWKKRGMYFFVHNKELRESYDTYKVIERLSKVGFQEQKQESTVVNNTYLINKKIKGV